jgi:small subunit ribosomal protein S24e
MILEEKCFDLLSFVIFFYKLSPFTLDFDLLPCCKVLEIIHQGRANVPKKEIQAKLAQMYKCDDPNQVVVYHMHTKFGGGRSSAVALIYDNMAVTKKFEPKYRLIRVCLFFFLETAHAYNPRFIICSPLPSFSSSALFSSLHALIRSYQNGLATKDQTSRKQRKERKNRAKKVRGVKKVRFHSCLMMMMMTLSCALSLSLFCELYNRVNLYAAQVGCGGREG